MPCTRYVFERMPFWDYRKYPPDFISVAVRYQEVHERSCQGGCIMVEVNAIERDYRMTLREGQKARVKARVEAHFYDDSGKITPFARRLLDSAIDQMCRDGNYTLKDAEPSEQHFCGQLNIAQEFNITLKAE